MRSKSQALQEVISITDVAPMNLKLVADMEQCYRFESVNLGVEPKTENIKTLFLFETKRLGKDLVQSPALP